MINTEKIETITLLDGKVPLFIPESGGLRPGLDAVMMAAACPAQAGDRVLEMGCGVGASILCLYYRVPGMSWIGMDIQSDLIDLACENAKQNNVPDGIGHFVTGDIHAPGPDIPNDGFDCVLCNPPYYPHGTHMPPQDPGRAKAFMQDADDGLDPWIRAAHRALRGRGSLTVIYPADRLDELIVAMTPRFGALSIIPLWPRVGVPATRVVVTGLKDRKGGGVKVSPGIILHDETGWTLAAQAILSGAGLG